MKITDKIIGVLRRVLPSPFTIAVLLSMAAYLLAMITERGDKDVISYGVELISYWESGIWNSNLLVFTIQMMMMLLLGHVLAITPVVDRFIGRFVKYCDTTAKAGAIVSFITIVVSLFNWGLGLVFGAIFARKVGEYAAYKDLKINYPLVGAAGYVGIMVWHGGISGSATTKAAENGHLSQLMANSLTIDELSRLPFKVGFEYTVFSNMNLFVTLCLITLVPLSLYILGKYCSPTEIPLHGFSQLNPRKQLKSIVGAEKLDHSKFLSLLFGGIILTVVLLKMTYLNRGDFVDFFNPNNINLMLLGLGVLLHENFNRFLAAVDEAISGISGILIQFPLYFGVMGILEQSGLIADFSDYLAHLSTAYTFPIFTFISASIVNLFVPSGGGQWAIQGPIIIGACLDINASLSKSIMALAYGDQISNMIQPFWALPLLGITKIKVREILPFSMFLFLIGLVIFLSGLLLF